MHNPQFRFHEDLEFLTSPTDRIPTIRMSAMVRKNMRKERICTEKMSRWKEGPIFARVPLLIFFGIFAFYALLLLQGVNMLLYVIVLVGSRLMK